MSDQGIRLQFGQGLTKAYVLGATGAIYTRIGSAANLTKTGTVHNAYALSAARGTYALSGAAQTFAYTPAAGTVAPPASVWPGPVTSNIVRVSWFPPDSFNVPAPMPTDTNTYKVYRMAGLNTPFNKPTATVVATGCVPRQRVGTGTSLKYWVDNSGLTPSTSYTYYVTTVDPSTAESGPSPPLAVTTLGGSSTSPTVPTAVPDPSGWYVPFALPTGTVWTCTNLSAGSVAGTGAQGNIGCSFSYALNHLNPAGGDVVVLTAGATYPGGGNGWQIQQTTGTTAWTYIISSEAPELGSTYGGSGKLPAFVPYTDPLWQDAYTLTAGPSIGATSATLSTTRYPNGWLHKTGFYPVQFYNATAGSTDHEQRYALFTYGSNTIDWNSTRNPCGIDMTLGPGLVFAAQTTISVKYLPGVTMYERDNGAVPIVKGGGSGTGIVFTVPAGSNNLRFVGIQFEMNPLTPSSPTPLFFNYYLMNLTGPCTNMYFDRCIFGTPTSEFQTTDFPNCTVASSTYGFCDHGVVLSGPNQWVHQCYFTGLAQSPASTAQDSQAIFTLGGGPYCIEYNHIEAMSEGFIFGGSTVGKLTHPVQATIRGNFGIKPDWWLLWTKHRYFTFTPATSLKSGDGTTTLFGLGGSRLREDCWYVQVNGVTQNPRTDYQIQGSAGNVTGIQFTTPPPVGTNNISIKGAAQFYFGDNIKNHFEAKALRGANVYGNTLWNCWNSNQPGYHGAAFAFGCRDQRAAAPPTNTTIFGGNPWVNLVDIDIHDNVAYRVMKCNNPFSAVDYGAPQYTARNRMRNNQFWVIGPASITRGGEWPDTLWTQTPTGLFPDYIVDNNTHVYNSLGTNIPGSQKAIFFTTSMSAGVDSAGFTQNPNWDRHAWRNNIFPYPSVVGGDSGLTLTSAFFTNPTYGGFDHNLYVFDTTGPFPPAPAVTYKGIAYASIGFVNFVDEKTPPTQPLDWNVQATTYTGTDGNPVGATIVPYSDVTGMFLANSFQGLSLAAPVAAGSNNWWQSPNGWDAKYANTLPRYPASLWGGTSPVSTSDQIQIIGSTSSDITNTLAIDNTVPPGVSNRVLLQTFVNAFNSSLGTQNTYQHFPSQSVAQSMIYTSRWMWLQADLVSRTTMGGGAGSFMMFSEFKTPDPGAERFGVQLRLQNWPGYGNVPTWEFYHDNTAVSGDAFYLQTILSPTGIDGSNQGIGQTHKCPVPLGRWFRLEFAYNRSDSSGQGWMWAAITDPGSTDPPLQVGVQVFAARGAFNHNDRGTVYTLGMNMAKPADKINRIYNAVAYSDITRSSGSTYVIKHTDVQLWNKWPAGATAHPAWS